MQICVIFYSKNLHKWLTSRFSCGIMYTFIHSRLPRFLWWKAQFCCIELVATAKKEGKRQGF